MKKIISLKRNSDFQRLYNRGKSVVKPTMVVYAKKGRGEMLRLGITATKKLGGAVERNRAKRRIRELFRVKQDELVSGYDICIVARNRVLNAEYDKVCADFMSAAKEIGLIAE